MKTVVLVEDGEKVIWSDVDREFEFHYKGGTFTIHHQEEDEHDILVLMFHFNSADSCDSRFMGQLRIPSRDYFKRGLRIRYFVMKDVLYFRYEDLKYNNVYAVGLQKDTVFAHGITEKMYTHLSRLSNLDVKKDLDQQKANRQKDVDLANLQVAIQTKDEEHQQKIAQLEQRAKDLEERYKREAVELKKRVEDAKEVSKQKQEYIDALPRNELASTRGKFTDFKIVCNDEVTISVHKAVLAAFWPFFNTMMENNCKENEDSTLNLDYSSDVVELLVADIYGQKIEFNFNQALSLLEITGLYDLSDLSAMAYEKILLCEPDLDLEDCVNGWRSARLGGHALGKTFFTKRVIEKTKPALEKDDERRSDFEGLTHEETLELFFDSLRM